MPKKTIDTESRLLATVITMMDRPELQSFATQLLNYILELMEDANSEELFITKEIFNKAEDVAAGILSHREEF